MLINNGTQIPIPVCKLFPKKKSIYTVNSKATVIYTIIKGLGEGGFGQVYLARCNRPDIAPPLLAIKMFIKKGKLTHSEQAINLIERDSEANNAFPFFKHVWAFNLSLKDKVKNTLLTYYCMTIEYMEGEILDLHNKAYPSVGEYICLATQVAADLFRLQQHGLIHHDISLRNILLKMVATENDRPIVKKYPFRARIIDYGLAIKNQSQGTNDPNALFLRPPSNFLGVTELLAPEETLMNNEAPNSKINEKAYIGTKTDVFAFGLVLAHFFEFDKAVKQRHALSTHHNHETLAAVEQLHALRKHPNHETLATVEQQLQAKTSETLAALVSFSITEAPETKPVGETPAAPYELLTKFIMNIFPPLDVKPTDFSDAHEKLLAPYQTRPSAEDCLQFLVWMNQIFQLFKARTHKSVAKYYQERLTILIAKCRLLVEREWPNFKEVDFEQQPAFCQFVASEPVNIPLDLKSAQEKLIVIQPIIPPHLVKHFHQHELPVAVYEEAISNQQLLLPLLEKIAYNIDAMKNLRDLLKRRKLSIELQHPLLNFTSNRINYVFHLLLSIDNPGLSDWLQVYFAANPNDRNQISFPGLTSDDLYELLQLTLAKQSLLLCILGRSQLLPLRTHIQEKLLEPVLKYKEVIEHDYALHGKDYYRGTRFGWSVGQKKDAVDDLIASFARFFSDKQPSTLTSFNRALKQGELGKIVQPILEKLEQVHQAKISF